MKDCPKHPEFGYECGETEPHRWHSARIYEDSDDKIGQTVAWGFEEQPPSPKAHQGMPSNKDLVKQIEDAGGAVGKNHPQTSKDAAATTDAKTQRDLLHRLLDEAGYDGLTNYDASPSMKMPPNQVATRMQELRKAGEAVGLQEKRETTKNHWGHVHVLPRFRNGREIEQSLTT